MVKLELNRAKRGSNSAGRMSTKIMKKTFIEAMQQALGIVTVAAKMIDEKEFTRWRRRHYLWLEKDEKYKAQIDDILEQSIDFVENKLIKEIKKGKIKAIEKYLDAHGKSRGYGKHENAVDGSENGGVTIIIEDVSVKENTEDTAGTKTSKNEQK